MTTIYLTTIQRRANDWIVGDDTGLSSRAIWSKMQGVKQPRWEYPRDPADFGRCHRLLERIPEWRERISEMAECGREWAALVSRWGEIETAYIGERMRYTAPNTYALMKEILKP